MTDTEIVLDQCPYCQASAVQIENKEGILVAGCGCMLSELEVRRLTGRDKREVAQL